VTLPEPHPTLNPPPPREAPPTSQSGAPPTQIPNQGVPLLTTDKNWYANERITLPKNWLSERQTNWPASWPIPWFDNDHKDLANRPGFHIFGLCPSCHHETTGVCATEYLSQDLNEANQTRSSFHADERSPLQGFAPLLRRSSQTSGHRPAIRPRRRAQVRVLRCACTANHCPPAGASGFGCGSEWLLHVTYQERDPSPAQIDVVPAEQAYLYWPAADAAAAEVPTSLTTAQSAAKNWGGALTALVTLVGVGTLLGNRATVSTLSTKAQVCFGILAFLAVLADAVMLYQSDFAMFGSTRIKAALRPSDLRNADLDPLIQASLSVRKLQISVRATAVAVVMALGATGILLFAKAAQPQPSPATFKITYRMPDGIKTTTGCGTLANPAATGGTLRFTPIGKGGAFAPIPVNKKVTIVAC
jgi:hypothetical protein